MTSTLHSGKRISRRLASTGGVSADERVVAELAELDAALGRRNVEPPPAPGGAGRAAAAGAEPGVVTRLRRPLTPRRARAKERWADESLVWRFVGKPEDDALMTMGEIIDVTPDLTELKYEFLDELEGDWFGLDGDARLILSGEYPNVLDYLVAYAFFVLHISELHALKHFVLENRKGVRAIDDYAAVSAARVVVDSERLRVDDLDDDAAAFARAVAAAHLDLEEPAFGDGVHKVVRTLLFDSDLERLLDAARIKVPPAMRATVIRHLKHAPVPITGANIDFFLPTVLAQVGGVIDLTGDGELQVEVSDRDFDVEYFVEDRSQLQVSTSSVKCAAQLFYSMVVGDELAVFDVVNYFTHRYLLREGFEIEDGRLRDDIQQYVFADRFTAVDPKTNTTRVLDRTRPAERQMFYRQVFDLGTGEMPEDLLVNDEFPRLWKVLILESAKYLERAQMSPNPDSFVSTQNVQQAVEDLRYNLSVHCTGMANVATPLIYEELNFVIKRILMHPEVRRHVVPAGGSWWKVVERLYTGMRGSKPKATVLYNKARYGNEIIRALADYDPGTFSNDEPFSTFISTVEAFIITQSILQEALTDDLKREHEGDDAGEGPAGAYPMPTNGRTTTNGHANASMQPNGQVGVNAPDAEWDF